MLKNRPLRKVPCHMSSASHQESPPKVLLEGVVKRFGNAQVLNSVDLEVATGEVCCVIGPSGSGKSTLLRMVNGLLLADEGHVRVDGELIGFRESKDHLIALTVSQLAEQRKAIGMVFQRFNLFPHLTATENVAFGPHKILRVSRSEANGRALTLLDKVGLSTRADYYPSELSGGQQQRVAIARALAMNPGVMLFDEPTSALDTELVGEVLRVMKELAGEGMTMMIVTHEIQFARDVADRLIVMDEGRIIESGPPGALLSNPSTARAKDFLSRAMEAR